MNIFCKTRFKHVMVNRKPGVLQVYSSFFSLVDIPSTELIRIVIGSDSMVQISSFWISIARQPDDCVFSIYYIYYTLKSQKFPLDERDFTPHCSNHTRMRSVLRRPISSRDAHEHSNFRGSKHIACGKKHDASFVESCYGRDVLCRDAQNILRSV